MAKQTLTGGWTFENVSGSIISALETAFDTTAFFTVDNQGSNQGATRRWNRYISGITASVVANGGKPTKGTQQVVSIDAPYERVAAEASYTDTDYYNDNMVPQAKIQFTSEAVMNAINAKVFTKLAETSKTKAAGATDGIYDLLVAAIKLTNKAEKKPADRVIICGIDGAAALLSEGKLQEAAQGEQVLDGFQGKVLGIPVILCDACPDNKVYLTEKAAVAISLREDTSVETDRDIESQENIIVANYVVAMALVDDTHTVEITTYEAE